MKRLVIASILMVFIIALTIYSTVAVDRACHEMQKTLERARIQALSGDYPGARESLTVFFGQLDEYELLFLLFVRRDLLYSIRSSTSTLFDYASPDYRQDFLAELERAIEQLHMVRHLIVQPA